MRKTYVAVVMGSEADLPVMQEAAIILARFEIEYEMSVLSIHHMPQHVGRFVESIQERGAAIVIAGASGAAHLPGMIAAHAEIPVIGVPIATHDMQGLDALLSIVQMPTGVPVATMSTNGAENAAMLAAQILGVGNPGVRKSIRTHKKQQESLAQAAAESRDQTSFERYLHGKGPL